MNTEMERTSFDADGHPDENQLLLALEGELPSAEAMQIEQHLGGCWSCRARSHELQRGILAFVEYREKRYLPSLPPPPHDFGGFRGQLRTAAAEIPMESTRAKVWRRLRALLAPPPQFRWAAVTATFMVGVVIWTQ